MLSAKDRFSGMRHYRPPVDFDKVRLLNVLGGIEMLLDRYGACLLPQYGPVEFVECRECI
jgi:hypothetical protein